MSKPLEITLCGIAVWLDRGDEDPVYGVCNVDAEELPMCWGGHSNLALALGLAPARTGFCSSHLVCWTADVDADDLTGLDRESAARLTVVRVRPETLHVGLRGDPKPVTWRLQPSCPLTPALESAIQTGQLWCLTTYSAYLSPSQALAVSMRALTHGHPCGWNGMQDLAKRTWLDYYQSFSPDEVDPPEQSALIV